MKTKRVAFPITIVSSLALACALGACGDDDAAKPPTSDGGTTSDSAPPDASAPDSSKPDTGAPDAATDAPSEGGATCGTMASGLAVTVFPSGGDASGATISYEGCAGTTTSVAGAQFATWSLMVSTTPSYFRLTKTGFHTSLSAEINPAVFAQPGALPLQLIGTAQLAGYDATKAHMIVSVGAVKNACTKDGNTVSLPGHPEAVVTYVNKNGVDVGASMSIDGLAWITGIVPGASPLVEPTVVSAVGGCTLSKTYSTGKAPTIVDTVSLINFELN